MRRLRFRSQPRPGAWSKVYTLLVLLAVCGRVHRLDTSDGILSIPMNWLQKLSIPVLLLCLANPPRAGSQAVFGKAADSSSSALQPGQAAPSGSVSSPGTVLQGDRLTSQTALRKASKAGSVRGSLATGATPRELTWLCFQPGIGWQRASLSPLGVMDGSSATGAAGSGASGSGDVNRSATTAASQPVFARPSGAKEAMSNECPEGSANGFAPEISFDHATAGSYAQSIASAHTIDMHAVAQSWQHGNSQLNPAGGDAFQSLTRSLGSASTGSTRSASQAESEAAPDRLNVFKNRAYVSSIEIRRMMRQAPDLMTRIRLQELQGRLAGSARTSNRRSTADKATEERPRDRSGLASHSSGISGNGNRTAPTSRGVSSYAYP